MIAEANRDIRWALRVADKQRHTRLSAHRPFAYLDEVIAGLETLHLDGYTAVPASFVPRLQAVSRLLPPGVEAPVAWRRRITRAIDQCFDLQERILRVGRRQGTCW